MPSYPPWMFVVDPREQNDTEPPAGWRTRLAQAHNQWAITARGLWTRLSMRLLLLAFRRLVPALTADPVPLDRAAQSPVSRRKTRVGVD